MPCYRPLKGYRAQRPNPSGKRSIVFNVNEGFKDFPVELPCGQCIGCRLERSRRWAVRCVHESQLHEENAFLTLTYSDENLPAHGSLSLLDFQNFMKRYRKHIYPTKIKLFHCGEYGEKLGRPHYHACIFGHDFKDKKKWKVKNGETYYESETLQKLWPFGHSTIGALTFESAAYVARYITKKINGRNAEEHYEIYDEETGEYLQKKPEYVTMSRAEGIGKNWFKKFKTDIYPDDFIILKGKKIKVPKYYDQLLEREDALEFLKINVKRKLQAEQNSSNNSWDRLLVREEIQHEKVNKLKRSYENG